MKKLMLVIMLFCINAWLLAGENEDALFKACRENDTKKVKELLDKGITVNIQNEQGITPLMIEVGTGYEEIATLLINKGANINAIDNNGKTVLTWAQLGGSKAIIELITFKVAKKIEETKETKTIMVHPEHYKEPGVAFILSFLLPAGGQAYNGDFGRMFLFDGMYIGSILLITSKDAYYNMSLPVGILLNISTWIASIIDAPVSANTHNRKAMQQIMLKKWDKADLGLNVMPKKDGAEVKATLNF